MPARAYKCLTIKHYNRPTNILARIIRCSPGKKTIVESGEYRRKKPLFLPGK